MTKDEALKLALHGLEMGVTLIEDFGSKEQLNTQHKAIAAIYEAFEQAKQESVTGIQYAQGIPFFIPPPQHTWVGLTDGEVDKMILLMGFPPDWITENAIVKNIVRNLEAKLKEKNT